MQSTVPPVRNSAETPENYLAAWRGFRPNARQYLGLITLNRVALAMFGVIFNIYLRQLGYSKLFVGVFTTFNVLASAAIALPAALLTRKLGFKRTFIIAMTVTAATCLGQVLFSSALPLLVFSTVRGAAQTLQGIAQAPFLTENSRPRERVHLFSINAASGNLASMVGNSFGGLIPMLLLERFGGIGLVETTALRYALLIAALGQFVSLIPLRLLREVDFSASKFKLYAGFAEILKGVRNRRVRQLAVVDALIGLGAGLIVPFFTIFLTEELHATTDQTGLIMAGSDVILIFATLISPFLVRLFGKVRSVVGSQLLSVPMLLTIAYAPYIWVATGAYWLRNALMNMSSPISGTFMMEVVPPPDRELTASLTSMVNNLGRAVSAVVGGYMMDRYGNTSPYMITALLYTAACVYYFVCFRPLDPHHFGHRSQRNQPVSM